MLRRELSFFSVFRRFDGRRAMQEWIVSFDARSWWWNCCRAAEATEAADYTFSVVKGGEESGGALDFAALVLVLISSKG